ncbi:MAG: F0F1 ATP synthase subunit B [Verrucomicrobia bacterium]|nr:F0F1 ATP synthase subunit B [Verrucomicrobiota bacterium]
MADSTHHDHAHEGLADADISTSIAVPAGAHADAHGAEAGNAGLITPEAKMVVLTWVTFGIVAFFLHKIAWKPILAALDAREARIRQSLDDATKARDELAQIEQTRKAMMVEAEKETKAMVASARDQAGRAAAQVEAGAHEKVKIMYENAARDIEAMTHKSIVDLRREQAGIVLSLAGRLVSENLDTDKNRALTDRLIAEL